MARIDSRWPVRLLNLTGTMRSFGSLLTPQTLLVPKLGSEMFPCGDSLVVVVVFKCYYRLGQIVMAEENKQNKGPEIVFGLVGAVGTDLELVQRFLSEAIADVSYRCVPIQLSKLM